MSTYGSGDISAFRPDRVLPIGDNNQDDEQKRKRKALYQGRTWTEKEEERSLPIPPHDDKPREKEIPSHIYANRLLLEKAKKILLEWPTLEEKCAQLCFLELEANYDSEKQQQLISLVQMGEVGGLLFSKGDFRRESYLVETLQDLSKFPLLIGNDFLQGLSFYFQRECTPDQLANMSEIHLCDLAKAVVFQNRKLGVQLQLVREGSLLSQKGFVLDKECIKAFANGIREAHGIVGREKKSQAFEPPVASASFALHPSQVQEVFSLRTLYFLDFTKETEKSLEEMIMASFKQTFDILLISDKQAKASSAMATLVQKGKISLAEIEKRLLKVILLKMMAFPLKFRC